MGIFGNKKEKVVEKTEAVVKAVEKKTPAKKAPKAKAEKKVVASGSNTPAARNIGLNNGVIIRPRITEKATLKADTQNVFVFEIAENATKMHVRNAITSIYNVAPIKVSIVRNPGKKVLYRGRLGMTAGVKKAYVYLKAGDKIEIV